MTFQLFIQTKEIMLYRKLDLKTIMGSLQICFYLIYWSLSILFLCSNIILMNLFASLAALGEVGVKSLTNFSSSDKLLNPWTIDDILPNRQFRFRAKCWHLIKKWNSSSNNVVWVWSLVVWLLVSRQILCSIGVTGRVFLPDSIAKLWALTLRRVRFDLWFLFLTSVM